MTNFVYNLVSIALEMIWKSIFPKDKLEDIIKGELLGFEFEKNPKKVPIMIGEEESLKMFIPYEDGNLVMNSQEVCKILQIAVKYEAKSYDFQPNFSDEGCELKFWLYE